jgi:hypothetical protein
LSFLSQQKCDELANNYLDVLIRSTSEIKKGNTYNNAIFAISLSTVIPEILSRLCLKCSYDIKIKLLGFTRDLYLSDDINRSKYKGVDKLVKYLIKSFSFQEQYKLIPELLKFPIIPDSNFRNEYPDPFDFVYIDNTEKFNTIKINAYIINELISYLAKDDPKRKIAITRLIILLQCNLLTKTLQNKFAKALWENVDNNGFPIDTNYYYFAFLKFPYPKSINPQERLRNYIQNTELPLQSKEKSKRIPITGGDNILFHNILGTTNKDNEYPWNKEDINNLISKVIEWWNADKEYLKNTRIGFGGSLADEFKARYSNMIKIFSNLIISYTTLIDKSNLNPIKILLEELDSYGMEDLEAKSSFVAIFPNDRDKLYSRIIKKLYSKNDREILDAVNAISVLVKQGKEDVLNLLESISDNIKCRTEIGFDRYVDAINVLLSRNEKLVTDKILVDIQLGFEYLYNEVFIEQGDTEERVHEKILKQRSASKLLVTLKKYYIEVLKLDLPQYLIDWEAMCLNVNEFYEIRNIWLNA